MPNASRNANARPGRVVAAPCDALGYESDLENCANHANRATASRATVQKALGALAAATALAPKDAQGAQGAPCARNASGWGEADARLAAASGGCMYMDEESRHPETTSRRLEVPDMPERPVAPECPEAPERPQLLRPSSPCEPARCYVCMGSGGLQHRICDCKELFLHPQCQLDLMQKGFLHCSVCKSPYRNVTTTVKKRLSLPGGARALLPYVLYIMFTNGFLVLLTYPWIVYMPWLAVVLLVADLMYLFGTVVRLCATSTVEEIAIKPCVVLTPVFSK